MKATPAQDLRVKSVEELTQMIADEKAAMYKTRRDMVFRQTTDTAGTKTRRHNIARMLTLITEKQKSEENQPS